MNYSALFASLLTLETVILTVMSTAIVSIYKSQSVQSVAIAKIQQDLDMNIKPKINSLHEFRNELYRQEITALRDELKQERENHVSDKSQYNLKV